MEAEVVFAADALHVKTSTIFLDSFSAFRAHSTKFQLYLIDSPRINSDFSHFPRCQRSQHSSQKLFRHRSHVPLLIKPQQFGLVHFLLFFSFDSLYFSTIFLLKLDGKMPITCLSSNLNSPGHPDVGHLTLLFCKRQCYAQVMRHSRQSWLCKQVRQFLQQLLTFFQQQMMHYRELLGTGRETCRWIYFNYLREVSSQKMDEVWRFFMMLLWYIDLVYLCYNSIDIFKDQLKLDFMWDSR